MLEEQILDWSNYKLDGDLNTSRNHNKGIKEQETLEFNATFSFFTFHPMFLSRAFLVTPLKHRLITILTDITVIIRAKNNTMSLGR